MREQAHSGPTSPVRAIAKLVQFFDLIHITKAQSCTVADVQ